ncbi:MAG: hypothetical protein ACYC5J_02715 [Chloroflexota bacterium]
MGEKPEEKPEPDAGQEEEAGRRHVQFPQESWTEIDAEGTDSEMAQGRESQEPFYTPLVTEAAERRLKKEREERARQKEEKEKEKEQKEKGKAA